MRDMAEQIAEGNALGGVARVVARWGSEVKTVSNKIFGALKDEGYEHYASVFVGKPDIRRAAEEQQNATYKAIEQYFDLKTPDQKRAAAMQTRWATEKNDNVFCYYFLEGGKPSEAIAAGKIKERELTVQLWIYDEGLRKEVYKQLQNMRGADKLLYRTIDKSHELKEEKDMLQFVPGEQELREQAAKGKGKDKDRSERGSGNDKGAGKGKKQGKDDRGVSRR